MGLHFLWNSIHIEGKNEKMMVLIVLLHEDRSCLRTNQLERSLESEEAFICSKNSPGLYFNKNIILYLEHFKDTSQ